MTEHDEQRETTKQIRRCRGWCKPKVHANPRYWIDEHWEHGEAGLELIEAHWIERPGLWLPGIEFSDGMCLECLRSVRVEAGLPPEGGIVQG